MVPQASRHPGLESCAEPGQLDQISSHFLKHALWIRSWLGFRRNVYDDLNGFRNTLAREASSAARHFRPAHLREPACEHLSRRTWHFLLAEVHDVLLVMYDHRARVFHRPRCPQSRDDAFLFSTHCSTSWIGLELRPFGVQFFFFFFKKKN